MCHNFVSNRQIRVFKIRDYKIQVPFTCKKLIVKAFQNFGYDKSL